RNFLCRLCDRYGWDWPQVQKFMKFAVWFHDIGKSSAQWQNYIKYEKGQITHALPSFAIGMASLKLEPRKFEPSPVYAALLAILAHHTQLHDSAFREEDNRINLDIPLWFIEDHFQYFKKKVPDLEIIPWKNEKLHLGMAARGVEILNSRIKNLQEKTFKALYSLMLNVLTASDGAASGMFAKQEDNEALFDSVITKESISSKNDISPFYDNTHICQLSFVEEPNNLQREILKCQDDRLILNAGCGEGKTAAALLFAQKLMRQDKIERIILTLPTKFTANNLFRDLMEKYKIPREIIGITHGDSYEFLRQLDDNKEDNENNLLSQEFENSFYARPVTISTVDHLLMSLYHGYKFADKAFFNILSSLVVFDEVHYYEGRTLEAIGEAMKLLTQLKVPHLVMTATIPSSIRYQMDNLCKGNNYPFLRVESFIPKTTEHKKPFEIVPLELTLFDEEKQISQELIHKIQQNSQLRQIVYINQVQLAKIAYKTLKEQDLYENLICHHAGFTSHDRQKKERIIRILFKPKIERKKEEIEELEDAGFVNSDNVVLISTQVSELSLDISADVMYSELAPVDSLVQRGGRLHRNGWLPNAPCGCKICDQ
ncbi:CRISPR-associated helicase Cas3', partial [Candidatus Poribacteria bacterium]|nr:CRISPR-associated helicase Cas3' [Candidatus Poribacteria bacterium]